MCVGGGGGRACQSKKSIFGSFCCLLSFNACASHSSEGMNNRCLMLIAQFYPDLLEIGVGGRSLDITGLVPLGLYHSVCLCV